MTSPPASQTALSIVAGGAGFIGSNLVRSLVARGRRVVVIDNLSNGRAAYLSCDPVTASVPLIEADLADRTACEAAFGRAATMGRVDDVWHMAANSDIPAGVADPDVDHTDTFLTTFEVLRTMQRQGIGTLHFASSSAIYGDLGETPLHEAIGPLLPISNYGAMKLASEAQISVAAESFLTRANIFRFPNVVSVPATHGVILDFVNKLMRNPTGWTCWETERNERLIARIKPRRGNAFRRRRPILVKGRSHYRPSHDGLPPTGSKKNVPGQPPGVNA